jgi:hypothetical protein
VNKLDTYVLLLPLGRYLCCWSISLCGIINPVVDALTLIIIITYISV